MNASQLSLALILFTVTTNATAQILLKRGMLSVGPLAFAADQAFASATKVLFNPWVLLGLVTFGISMLSHLVVLSRVDLSFAYPFLSLAYIIVAGYAFFIFGENVGPIRLIGYGLICAGTLFVAAS